MEIKKRFFLELDTKFEIFSLDFTIEFCSTAGFEYIYLELNYWLFLEEFDTDV